MTDQKFTRKQHRKLVAIDFDGVLHSYTSPWTNAATISDGPTPGAMQFLRRIVEDGRFEVVVVSSRCSCPLGVERIEEWLQRHLIEEFGQHDGHGLFSSGLRVMQSNEGKLPATVTLDDRAVTFLGTWPSLDRLAAFQPWNKKPKHLRADPETAVAANDALMQRIGRIAQETGCPDGVQALVWLEERARIGHAVASDTTATFGKLSDEDMETLRAMPIEPGAILPMPRGMRLIEEEAFRGLLASAWDLGAGTAYARRDRPADYEADGKSDETIRGLDVERVIEKAEQKRGAAGRPTVDGVPVMSVDEMPKPGGDDEEDGEPGFCGIAFFRDGDRIKAIRQSVDEDDNEMTEAEVEYMLGALDWFRKYVRSLSPKGRKWQERLDREFAPYADIEALILDAVPPGTPVSRASAGGDLGWRVGWGWMSVEGTDAARPDLIRGCAQSLAAIPGMSWEKPRNGDPELVERVLAAGRAM